MICKLPPGSTYKLKVWAYSQAGEGPSATIDINTQIMSESVFYFLLLFKDMLDIVLIRED